MTKRKYLTNDEMGKAFGGYDFRTQDMKAVCKAQRELTLKEIRCWLNSLPIKSVNLLPQP